MGFLRTAVEKQKQLLIDNLIQAGVYKVDDEQLYDKTISELITDYRKYVYKHGGRVG